MLADFYLEWDQGSELSTDSEIWFHPSREDGVEKYRRPKIKPRVFLSERG